MKIKIQFWKTMRPIKTILILLFGLSISAILTGCGPTDDKTQIQSEIDKRNPNNSQAFCIRVTKNYKYDVNNSVIIHSPDEEYSYIDVESLRYEVSQYELNQIMRKKELLSRLQLFDKAGLLEKVILNENTKFYMYIFNKKSTPYLNVAGGTNLCFGRIIVDEIVDTADNEVNNDGQFKVITFSYHLDDVPDWMKDESIYSLYASHTDFINLVLGKQLTGKNIYKVADDGTLTLWDGIRGRRYIL